MSEPTGFYKDEQGRTRPITAPEGQTFQEPPLQMQQQTGLAYKSHEADPNHKSTFRNVWGFYEKVGHLAFKHATQDPDARMEELLTVPEDRLANLHDRLHHSTEAVVLSTEERELMERIRTPMQLTPQVTETQSQQIIRPEIPDFGVPIKQQFYSPSPPPYYGPTGKRLTRDYEKAVMKRSARIRQLMDEGKTLEEAAGQAIQEGELVPY